MVKKIPAMPRRLFPIDCENPDTWPWIDCKVVGTEKAPRISKWVKNPKFKYGHLIEGYESCR